MGNKLQATTPLRKILQGRAKWRGGGEKGPMTLFDTYVINYRIILTHMTHMYIFTHLCKILPIHYLILPLYLPNYVIYCPSRV